VLSDHALSRALEGAGLSAPVRFEEVTRSTQETAWRLAEDGAPEWTLVAAGHQTEGRGRLGRTWKDEPGRALLFSLVLRPPLVPELGGLLSLLAGTAMAEACDEVANQRAACKWPNDVLVAGAKAGGILAESRLAGDRFEFVALGVGVNLGTAPAGLPHAGAVQAEGSDLLGAFLRAFAGRYEPAQPDFARAIVDAYRTRCATLGTSVRARTGLGTVVEGEAVDVDETGALLVRVGGAIEVVRFGEVEHLE
jgi:BirA family transcriptional regulator, biotin operon repressor / biotin---[acetyl-CoA-carboxylase] ligase